MDELQNIRDERIKIARKAYDLAKAKLKLSKSQLKAMLAIRAHVSALAKNAVSSGDDAHVALKLRTTSLAAEAGIHVKKYIKALKARKGVLLEKLNVHLAEAGQKPVVEKDKNKTPQRRKRKEQPSWATPELDKLGTTVAEKLEKANEARNNLDVALGLSSDASDSAEAASGPAEAASGPAEAASGPAEVANNVTEAKNSTELSPFEVLKKRMAGIAKMAREMLGGPKRMLLQHHLAQVVQEMTPKRRRMLVVALVHPVLK